MKIKSLLSFLLCFVCLTQAYSQNNTQFVKGVVMDQSNGGVVAFSTMTAYMLNDKGTVIDSLSQVCDDKGIFEISLPKASKYRFTSRFVGMSCTPVEQTAAQLATGRLVRIYMNEDTKQLQAVTVTARRPLVRIAADRLQYNVADDPMSKTNSLSDMLRKVPLVTVDGEGNVMVKGSKSFRIYMNGHPSKLFEGEQSKNILKSINASSVKKIEVITNPGVEYDAEGAPLILNIITESSVNFEGMQGTVTLNPYITSWGGGSANVTASVGKLTATATANVMVSKTPRYLQQKQQLIDNRPTHQSVADIDFTAMSFLMQVYSLSLNYQIHKHHLLSTSFTYNHFKSLNINYTENTKLYAPGGLMSSQPTSIVEQNIHSENNNQNIEARADYQITTNREGERITLSYLYVGTPSFTGMQKRGNMKLWDASKNGYADPVEIPNMLSESRSNMNEHTAQIDYVRPFGEKHKLIAGAKYIHRSGFSLSEYVDNPLANSFLNDMKYTQQVVAGYSAYTLSLEHFGLIAGLRYEWGNLNVRFPKDRTHNFGYHFHDLVPQLILTYNFDPTTQLKLAYNFTVKRPSITQLNPYTDVKGSTLSLQGNPHLRNERHNAVDLSFNYIKGKFTTQSSITGNYSKEPIVNTMIINKEHPDVLVQTFQNLGYSSRIGVSNYTGFNATSWLAFYLNASVGYNKLVGGKVYDPVSKKHYTEETKGWDASTSLFTMFNLPNSWSLFAYAGYYRRIYGFRIEPFWLTDHGFGVNKAFLKGRLNTSLNITNPFKPYNDTTIKIKGVGVDMVQKSRFSAFSVMLSVSYTFGELKKVVGKAASTIKNDDLSTVSQNMNGGTK